MFQVNARIFKIVICSITIALHGFTGHGLAHADNPGVSKAGFFVAWYDVGQAALEGLNGVKQVKKDFRGFKETNTVYYDPNIITIKEMEAALKKAGTYLGNAK